MDLITTLFTLLISFILPLMVLGYLIIKKRQYLVAYICGAITFFVFQVLIRIPLIQVFLPRFDWYFTMAYEQPYLYALFLGITAALFEELGRYVVIKLFMKKRHSFNDALFFGIGHGGIEAILLVGINALLTLVYYQGQNGAPLMMTLAGLERLSTMIIHIFFSILVMYGIKTKSAYYLVLVIILHFALDAGIVIAQLLGVGIIMIELIMVMIAGIAIVYGLRFKAKWRDIDEINV